MITFEQFSNLEIFVKDWARKRGIVIESIEKHKWWVEVELCSVWFCDLEDLDYWLNRDGYQFKVEDIQATENHTLLISLTYIA